MKSCYETKSFYDVQEYMAQLKLYEVQNQLRMMDYIEFRGLLGMAKEPDPTAADDKGSKALTFSHQKKPYGLPNNTMP